MEWEHLDKSYAFLKCTRVKYVNDLIEKGTIMFNCAQNWVDIAKKKGQGQGDVYEGSFAACNILDINSMISFHKQYDDVEFEINDKLIYFRRKSVMYMPAFCFYTFKSNYFESRKEENSRTFLANAMGRYFEDFEYGMTSKQIMLLDKKERPAIVIINDGNKFIKMVKEKLVSMGVRESEILDQSIEYVDKRVAFCNQLESPKELFFKDKSFSHQAEGRIIINTKNKSLMDILVKQPINIGSIKEFSKKIDIYGDY